MKKNSFWTLFITNCLFAVSRIVRNMADFMNENESKEEREREEEDEDEEDEEDTYVDEDEEYSYKSEDDELLPSLERAYSDEIFIVPEGGCVFVNYKGENLIVKFMLSVLVVDFIDF